jgi:hypothetical protein
VGRELEALDSGGLLVKCALIESGEAVVQLVGGLALTINIGRLPRS